MKSLAIHESAHSVAAFALGLPVQYVSIRPHADDAGLTAHILNARLHRTRTRVEDHETFTLTKPAPGRLIDGAVASVLAYEAHAQEPPLRSRN